MGHDRSDQVELLDAAHIGELVYPGDVKNCYAVHLVKSGETLVPHSSAE
jgi:hypothetical protein